MLVLISIVQFYELFNACQYCSTYTRFVQSCLSEMPPATASVLAAASMLTLPDSTTDFPTTQ